MLEKINLLKSELDDLRPISPEREQQIMQKFRLDWNYHSNHLEGNSLTFGETKALILFGLTAQGKPIKDHLEITGHNEALKWIEEIARQDFPITELFIRELHQLLLKEPYQVDAITPDGLPVKKTIQVGSYKTTPNHVLTKTGEIFRFATPEETPAKMYDLINWLREKQANPENHPVFTAAEFHYKFIRIHPFDDGNGRVARILMNLILMQNGFPPVIIKTEEKQAYLFALQQADAGIFEPFVDFIIQNLERSLEIMVRGARGENIEEAEDFDKELALLEQKMKSVGKAVKEEKNKENTESFYEDSFSRLCEKFVLVFEKFEKFYLKTDFLFSINSSGMFGKVLPPLEKLGYKIRTKPTHPTLLDYSFSNSDLSNYLNRINTLTISISFNTIKNLEFSDFSYKCIIVIEFDKLSYSIKNSDGNVVLTETYGNNLTQKFIDDLVNSEKLRHKKFLEEILDNKKV